MIAALGSILSELATLATAASAPASTTADLSATAPAGNSFADLFSAAIDRLDGTVSTANAQAKTFAAGSEDLPLSDVMVSLEQASLSLQLASNIRDKVTAAYSNVMNMPV
jgi:flagellar hook-basal body complex protein FliE